jgi:hypothetical protein
MVDDTLIQLPVFDAVAKTAADFLQKGMNVAIVGPPGSGATTVASRIQRELSAAKRPFAVFDCAVAGELSQLLTEHFDPKLEKGQRGVIVVDHAGLLPLDQLQSVAAHMREIALKNSTAFLWLGALDTRSIKAATGFDLHTDTRTHLCLPELARDDLLRLYQAIATRDERFWGQWGEAMLYFVLDWCGNDLALVEELVEHFYGDWTQRIYDESVVECLRNWLAESPAVGAYRNRLAALPEPCKKHLRLLCAGGKLILHRPEIHLETSEDIRRLALSGFLCTNLLPGYYQFRNLLARYVVEEQSGTAPAPIELLRRSANGRVNALLQDIEVALRAMLRNVFRQMQPSEVYALLKGTKTDTKFCEPELQRILMEWADQLPVIAPFVAKSSLIQLLKEERVKFETSNNLWTKICKAFAAGLSADVKVEPTPEQTVAYLTFAELSSILQTLSDSVFLNKSRLNRIIDPPKKRWSDYLTKVRRLRNDAAHLRNIGFQDIEDLLEILNAMRRDQLDFLIMPEDFRSLTTSGLQ